jgi:hypothetical protein
MRLTTSIVPLLFVAALACNKEGDSGSLVVERAVVGDTTIVRTVSGSTWGDTARLVEEVKIGALEGPEELTFGAISHVAVADDGSMHIFDGQAVALRKFDSTGKFVGTIGRRGQGPGEYQMLIGAHFLGDGRLALYDGNNSRISTYSASGESLETWPLQLRTRMFADNAFLVDSSDHLYILTSRSAPGPTSQGSAVLLRMAPGGAIVDTVAVPTFPQNSTSRGVCLAPRGQWAFHPSGAFVTGVSDAYSLDIRPLSGSGVVRIQRAVQPVAFASGERAELEADIAASGPPIESVSITRGQDPVIVHGQKQTVPATKPFFRRVITGDDGRIWVQVHAPAQKLDASGVAERSPCNADRKGEPMPMTWSEPIVWDVFEADGRYLGPVVVPPRTTLRRVRGDKVWAVHRGESDEEYLVRFRLAVPDTP